MCHQKEQTFIAAIHGTQRNLLFQDEAVTTCQIHYLFDGRHEKPVMPDDAVVLKDEFFTIDDDVIGASLPLAEVVEAWVSCDGPMCEAERFPDRARFQELRIEHRDARDSVGPQPLAKVIKDWLKVFIVENCGVHANRVRKGACVEQRPIAHIAADEFSIRVSFAGNAQHTRRDIEPRYEVVFAQKGIVHASSTSQIENVHRPVLAYTAQNLHRLPPVLVVVEQRVVVFGVERVVRLLDQALHCSGATDSNLDNRFRSSGARLLKTASDDVDPHCPIYTEPG